MQFSTNWCHDTLTYTIENKTVRNIVLHVVSNKNRLNMVTVKKIILHSKIFKPNSKIAFKKDYISNTS